MRESKHRFLVYARAGLALIAEGIGVAEGIDGASRTGTDLGADGKLESVVGQAWTKITATAKSGGLRVTLDLFATESNFRAERYRSR